jgi:nitrogen regulatory protein PII
MRLRSESSALLSTPMRPVPFIMIGAGSSPAIHSKLAPADRRGGGEGGDAMKMVVAYIRHEAFEPIREELLELGFPSLSISEVKGSGRQRGITERFRGAELASYLRPKLKLECVVADGDVQTVADTILKHARTGAVGDGKLFVMAVEEAYRIRTGESGEDTLQAHPGTAPLP